MSEVVISLVHVLVVMTEVMMVVGVMYSTHSTWYRDLVSGMDHLRPSRDL